MINYTKQQIIKLAKEHGFRRDTLEKVIRLIDILVFINNNPNLQCLALKGGTAINLTIFSLPRLSVDIDLDYCSIGTKETMLTHRETIRNTINKYMVIKGYILNANTRYSFALDSISYSYFNSSNNKDSLKIEINYMNRTHIYDQEYRLINVNFSDDLKVLTLHPYELFGSKIKALIERCTIRDVYDVHQMIVSNIFNNEDLSIIKKCTVFYMIIGNTTNIDIYDMLKEFYIKIENYNTRRIPQYLSSTLKDTDIFEMIDLIQVVKSFIIKFMTLTENESLFISEFYKGVYNPGLLFENETMVDRILNHPMALWKIDKFKQKQL